MACVADKGEKGKQHHRPRCISEADHAVGCQSESQVADHRLRRINRPPDIVLSIAGKELSVSGRAMEDPWHESDDTKDVQTRIERDNDFQQQFEAAVLDAAQLFAVLWRQSAEVGVSTHGDLGG